MELVSEKTFLFNKLSLNSLQNLLLPANVPPHSSFIINSYKYKLAYKLYGRPYTEVLFEELQGPCEGLTGILYRSAR